MYAKILFSFVLFKGYSTQTICPHIKTCMQNQCPLGCWPATEINPVISQNFAMSAICSVEAPTDNYIKFCRFFWGRGLSKPLLRNFKVFHSYTHRHTDSHMSCCLKNGRNPCRISREKVALNSRYQKENMFGTVWWNPWDFLPNFLRDR